MRGGGGGGVGVVESDECGEQRGEGAQPGEAISHVEMQTDVEQAIPLTPALWEGG